MVSTGRPVIPVLHEIFRPRLGQRKLLLLLLPLRQLTALALFPQRTAKLPGPVVNRVMRVGLTEEIQHWNVRQIAHPNQRTKPPETETLEDIPGEDRAERVRRGVGQIRNRIDTPVHRDVAHIHQVPQRR